MTANDTLNVLLIEDDEDDYLITRSLLSKAQVIECELTWKPTFDDGLEALLTEQYDACLVDYRLGARTGLDLLEAAKDNGCQTPVILLTGQGDLKIDIEAMEAGAADYLNKNQIDAPLLERSLRYARERGDAEERIRKQAALLDKARDAIIAYDMDGHVIYWNKSAERLTGWSKEEMLGKRANDYLFDDEQREKLPSCWKAVKETDEWKGELHQQTKDGEEIIVESRWTLVREADGTPESVLVINTDITERKQLESQFLRSQRMESIGRLVSGIAHDLGNLLVPISLGVKVLQQRFSDDEKAIRTLSMIQNSAERGSDMVEQVLAFARGVEGERVMLQPETVIDDVRNITGETFPEEIDVDVEVDDDLEQVMGDATQVQQVLMNLCVNARDAMPDGGTLTIRAENTTLEEEDARKNIDAEPGEYVCLAVADTGVGMPDEVVDKIFEPFYTTKPEGEGTGLGLSTAYSIIKGHDGFIDVSSTKGEGTTFRIFLPVATDEETTDDERPTTVMQNGEGTRVFLVDDEPNILSATRDALEQSGFQVDTAPNGQEALDQLKARQFDVDVLITDIVMPNLDGVSLIKEVHAARPDVPIIAASGLADSRTDDALDAGADVFLSKPFTDEKLRAALQQVLHREDEPATT
jgi:PAS domain S-box-containing protein